MSRVATLIDSLVVIPSGYTGASRLTAGSGAEYQPSNGYHEHTGTASTTTAARWTTATTAGYVYYTFSISGIPSDATITSVSCIAKIWINNTSRVSNTNIALYSGTTSVGNSETFANTSTSNTVTITNSSSLSVSQANNLRIRFGGTRASNYNNGYIYFWGATLTINYSYQGTEYQISITNNASGVTVSPTGTDNWVAEGGSQTITFTNVSDISTLGVTDTNLTTNITTNVTSQLVNTSGTIYTYTIENISVDHTITVSTVTAYNITASSEVPSIATVNPSSGRAGQGSNYDLLIITDELTAIKVYDGNTDVTNQLHQATQISTETADFYPTQYISGNATNYTNYPSANALNPATNSSNYSGFYSSASNTNQYFIYGFNINLPENTNIKSVSCLVHAYVNNNYTSYVTTRNVQLYSGTTAKGSATSFSGTDTTFNITDCGDWTLSELQNARIRFDFISTNTSSRYRINFYGATLTIEYEFEEEIENTYKYTITNVTAAHTVTVREASYFNITGTVNNLPGVSFNNLPKKIYTSGSSYSISIDGITNPYSYRLTDNNGNVTSDVTSSVNYFNGNVTKVPNQYLNGSASPINPNNGLTGSDSTTSSTMRVTSNCWWEYGFDISNIPSTAIITSISCSVKAYISSSTSINIKKVQLYSGTTAKGNAYTLPTSNSTYNLTCGTWNREELDNIKLRFDANYTGTSNYNITFYGATLTIEYYDCSYTLNNITSNHTLILSEAPYYSVTGTSTFDGKSITGTSNKIYHGDSITVGLSGITDVNSFRLYDGITDVTSSVNTANWTFTLNNITASHTLRLDEAPYSAIQGISSFEGTGQVVFQNIVNVIKIYVIPSTFTINISNTTGSNNAYVLYEYINTSSHDIPNEAGTPVDIIHVTNNRYVLSISSVDKGYYFVIHENDYYAVTGTSNFDGVTITGTSNKVYQGDSITITINGITDPASYTLYDSIDGGTTWTDVTSSVTSGTYRYTISNIQGAHTLKVKENSYFTIIGTIGTPTLSGAGFSGLPKKIYTFSGSYTVVLTGITDPNSFRLTDNDFDVTNFVDTDTYKYTISAIQEDHELVLEEANHYSVTEENSTLSGATLNGTTNKAYEGTDVEVSITGVSNPYSIKLLDNEVDVSDKLVIPSTEGTYEVSTAPEATYGFNLNTGTGYYTSTNDAQANTAAVARVTFNLGVRSRITIKYINYAEATYDYGIFGNIDTALGTTSTIDSNVKYECSSSSDNTSDEQTLTYDINKGEHFIDIKFRKDNYTDENNDSLQFKIDSIVALDNPVPVYSITSISENHVLTLSLQDTVTVTTSSSYNGASLDPVSATIYKGEPLQLTLTVSDISLVSVRVTNSKTSMVTGIFTDNGNGTYTGILTIRENSTVTVIQKVTYTITCTDNATNGNITPTGTQSIDGGYDAEYIIESDHFDRIYLKDNNVIVNDLIERYELPEITNTFIPASFDSTNSTYSSVYNSNNPENGLTASNSSTRCCVYSNTGSNAVSKLIYNFDCSSIPENVTIDSVTCTAGASCYSNGQYFATRTLQLYSGDTAKGTATTITGNGSTNTSHTLNCGSWTREELNNIKIIVYITRSTSNTTTNASFSFFGASLSITYHANYYGYTIENVSSAHTLILSDRLTYQITSSSTANGVAITPSGTTTVYEGNDISFTIDALNITKIKVIDGVDVTASLTGSAGAFIYTIQNVTAAHTVTVSNKLTIYLKDTNAWISCSKIFKKVNGNWVEQTSAENLFEANKIYVKG